jgi:hypothetical protein
LLFISKETTGCIEALDEFEDDFSAFLGVFDRFATIVLKNVVYTVYQRYSEYAMCKPQMVAIKVNFLVHPVDALGVYQNCNSRYT